MEASIRREIAGTIIENPIIRRTTTANLRSTLGSRPIELSRADMASVRIAKDIATPVVMPSGRFFDFD